MQELRKEEPDLHKECSALMLNISECKTAKQFCRGMPCADCSLGFSRSSIMFIRCQEGLLPRACLIGFPASLVELVLSM